MISNNTSYIIFPIRIYQRFCRVLGFSLQWLTTGREFSPLTCWPRPLGSKPHDFHQPCGNYPGLSDLVDQRPGCYSLHWLSRRSYWRLGICWPTRSSWVVERWRRIFSGFERRIWSIFHYIVNLVLRAIWLVLICDLLNDRRTDDDSTRFKFDSYMILWTNHNSLLSIATNQFASFWIDNRLRQSAVFVSVKVAKFEIKRLFLPHILILYYIKQTHFCASVQ